MAGAGHGRGENALLISIYGLDAQPYGDSGEAVTWENSALRRWLQGDLLPVCVQRGRSGRRSSPSPTPTRTMPDTAPRGGNDTVDTVFALSIEEAEGVFPRQG